MSENNSNNSKLFKLALSKSLKDDDDFQVPCSNILNNFAFNDMEMSSLNRGRVELFNSCVDSFMITSNSGVSVNCRGIKEENRDEVENRNSFNFNNFRNFDNKAYNSKFSEEDLNKTLTEEDNSLCSRIEMGEGAGYEIEGLKMGNFQKEDDQEIQKNSEIAKIEENEKSEKKLEHNEEDKFNMSSFRESDLPNSKNDESKVNSLEENLNVNTSNNSQFKKREKNNLSKPKTEGDYNQGRWLAEEHNKFIQAMYLFGNEWKKVQEYIGTRSSTQARSHAQKFFIRLKKTFSLDSLYDEESIQKKNDKIMEWIEEMIPPELLNNKQVDIFIILIIFFS